MSIPTVDLCVAVLLSENIGDIFHGGICGDPAIEDVWEVVMTVVTFVLAVKANGTPERFDIAEHFRAKRPDTGHPIAVETPDEIVADQIFELVA